MRDSTALSPVDAAWLRMDSEVNPMVITAMLTLDGPIDPIKLDELVRTLVQEPRFRLRAVVPTFGVGVAHWAAVEPFDYSSHVHRVALPSPGADAALRTLLAEIMSCPLDRQLPLWQLHVVTGLAGGRSALIMRVHHCVGDGVALVHLLRTVTGSSAPHDKEKDEARPATNGGHRWTLRGVSATVRAAGKLLLLPPDSRTRLKGGQSREKRAAWSRALDLGALKEAATVRGATVNDVLLAAAGAALWEYVGGDGSKRALTVRAIIPVFLGAEDSALGNHFGLVFASLPLDSQTPDERVQAVRRRMDAIKSSKEAGVAFTILALAGLSTAFIERVVVDLFSRKGSVMVTNVRGPSERLSFAGRTLESTVVWAPTAGHVALGISFLSYAGELRMGVVGDAARVPDPQSLVAAFERDVERLVPSVFDSPRG